MDDVEQVYVDIERIRQKVPFGEVTFTLQQHGGHTVGLSVNNIRTEKYDDNAKAASAVISTIKQAIERGASGDLAFSVKLTRGRIDRIMWQSYDRIRYDAKKE